MNRAAFVALSLFARVVSNRVWMLLPLRVRMWWAGEWVRRNTGFGR